MATTRLCDFCSKEHASDAPACPACGYPGAAPAGAAPASIGTAALGEAARPQRRADRRPKARTPDAQGGAVRVSRRGRAPCPHCGADVAADQIACRACGSDAATGWRPPDEIESEGVALPETDDPEAHREALLRENPGDVRLWGSRRLRNFVIGILLVAAMVVPALIVLFRR